MKAVLAVFSLLQLAMSNDVVAQENRVQSPQCEQAVHDEFDSESFDKYTGQTTTRKVFIKNILDAHNTQAFGGHTIYVVIFEIRKLGKDGSFRIDPSFPPDDRLCILDKQGNVLGLETKLR